MWTNRGRLYSRWQWQAAILLVAYGERHPPMLMCRLPVFDVSSSTASPNVTAIELPTDSFGSAVQNHLPTNGSVTQTIAPGWRCDRKTDCSAQGSLAPELAASYSSASRDYRNGDVGCGVVPR